MGDKGHYKVSYRAALTKQIILCLCLILILIAISLAWFIYTGQGELSKLEASAKPAISVTISDETGENWSNELVIDLGTQVKIKELSGDGENLFLPVYDTGTITGYQPADMKGACFEYIFQLKTDTSVNIYLSQESKVEPADATGNKNEFGISRDYIAGAVRAAFLLEAGAASGETVWEKSLIWAPNTAYEYVEHTINLAGTIEDAYSYQTGTGINDVISIPTGKNPSGASLDGTFLWGDLAGILDSKPVLTILTDQKKEVTKKLKLRVWVEGTDREAVRDLYLGRVKLYFNFVAKEIEG